MVSPFGISSPYFLKSLTEYGELKHSGRTIKSRFGWVLRALETRDSTLWKFANLSLDTANCKSAKWSFLVNGVVVVIVDDVVG